MEKKRFFWVWVIFFLVLIICSPLIEGGETYETISWLRLWVIGFGLFYFLRPLKKGHLELAIPIYNRVLVLLWLILTGSLFITSYYYSTIYWYSNILVYFLFFYLVLNLLSKEQGERVLSAIFFILIGSGLVQSTVGIIEYVQRDPGRVSATFFNPSYYAGYLLGLIGFPLAGLVFDLPIQFSRKNKFWLKIGLGISLMIIGFGMLISASRSMVFGLIPLSLVLVVRFRRKAILVLILLVLGLILVPNPLSYRLKNLNRDPYAWERIGIWKSSLRMIRGYPLGVGLGNYRFYYHRYPEPLKLVKFGRYGKEAGQAHNEFLNFACEASLLSPLVLFGFWALILGRALKKLKAKEISGEEKLWLTGFSGSLLGILAHSLVDANLHQPPIIIITIINTAGLISVMAKGERSLVKNIESEVHSSWFWRVFLILSFSLIGLLMTYQALIAGFYFRSLNLKTPEERIKRLTQLSRFPAGYAPLYFQLGVDLRNQFLKTGEVEFLGQAIRSFELAIQLNPENYQYYYQSAECIYRLGVWLKIPAVFERAESALEQAIKRAPAQVFSYMLLAEISGLKSEMEKSLKWLETALEYEPYFMRARLLKTEILIEQGKINEARQEFELISQQLSEIKAFLKDGVYALNYYQQLVIAVDEKDLAQMENRLKNYSQEKPIKKVQ